MTNRHSAPELETLLAALRLGGFNVGVSEILRLRQVFALQPKPSNDPARRVKTLLRSIILKDRGQALTFDRIVDDWWQALAPVWTEPHRAETARTPPKEQTHSPNKPAPKINSKSRLQTWAKRRLLPLLALLLVILSDRHNTPTAPPPDKPSQPPTGSPKPPVATQPTPQPAVRLVPQISFTPPLARWQGEGEVGLALLALSGLAGLRIALRRRHWLPKAEPLPSRAGPPRLWLGHGDQEPVLLDRAEQLELVWGMDRYIADTPTRQLDIPATVRASAKTGCIPVPCFQRAQHSRSLWLWLDESAEDANLRRLLAELEGLLPKHGLPLETARFWGAPFTLAGALGERFAPREIEEQRDTAWVAILTDGKDIARQNRQDDQRAKLNTLLRGLSHWPKLWFVDASEGTTGLPAILKPHGLDWLLPEQLARRIGSEKARATFRSNPDERLWEAACALSPAPVETGMAWRLRKQLQLNASPWLVRNWQTRAMGPAGRLLWPTPLRTRLINGLWAAESHNHTNVGAGLEPAPSTTFPHTSTPAPTPPNGGEKLSLFDQALGFWLKTYRDEEAKQQKDSIVWADSPAQQHWRMETALLKLWKEPASAIPELYRLFQGNLKTVIPQQLAHYAPRPNSEKPPLPPNIVELSRHTGRESEARVRRYPEHREVNLACPPWRLDSGNPCRNDDKYFNLVPKLQLGNAVFEAPASLGTVNEQAGACKEWVPKQELGNQPNTHILLPWAWGQRSGREQKMLQAMGFALGMQYRTMNLRPPARQWLGLALVFGMALGAGFTAWHKPPALPTGKPKVVHGPGHPAKYLQSLTPLTDGRWRLAIATHQDHVGQTLPDAALARVDWTPKENAQHPASTCTDPDTKTKPECMAFQTIPAGDFTMGSPPNEPNHQNDELAHPVSLSGFQMGRYEVTNAQFHAYDPSHKEDDDRPAANVDWQQAHDFCQHYGYRLPTEAEWEYAARAGSTTRFPFGDDPSQLKDYAWYSANAGGDTHPVGKLKPNAWGLYDMLGNVWEWVEDWYEPYQPQPQTDPTGPEDGTLRVLRGGSYFVVPEYLRSAIRNGDRPEDRGRYGGFRCARGPRRQH